MEEKELQPPSQDEQQQSRGRRLRHGKKGNKKLVNIVQRSSAWRAEAKRERRMRIEAEEQLRLLTTRMKFDKDNLNYKDEMIQRLLEENTALQARVSHVEYDDSMVELSRRERRYLEAERFSKKEVTGLFESLNGKIFRLRKENDNLKNQRCNEKMEFGRSNEAMKRRLMELEEVEAKLEESLIRVENLESQKYDLQIQVQDLEDHECSCDDSPQDELKEDKFDGDDDEKEVHDLRERSRQRSIAVKKHEIELYQLYNYNKMLTGQIKMLRNRMRQFESEEYAAAVGRVGEDGHSLINSQITITTISDVPYLNVNDYYMLYSQELETVDSIHKDRSGEVRFNIVLNQEWKLAFETPDRDEIVYVLREYLETAKNPHKHFSPAMIDELEGFFGL